MSMDRALERARVGSRKFVLTTRVASWRIHAADRCPTSVYCMWRRWDCKLTHLDPDNTHVSIFEKTHSFKCSTCLVPVSLSLANPVVCLRLSMSVASERIEWGSNAFVMKPVNLD